MMTPTIQNIGSSKTSLNRNQGDRKMTRQEAYDNLQKAIAQNDEVLIAYWRAELGDLAMQQPLNGTSREALSEQLGGAQDKGRPS